RVLLRAAETLPRGLHVAGAMEARAVAVGAPDLEVAVAGPADDRDGVAGRRSRERSGARAVADRTAGHALVRAGDRVLREVASSGVALHAQPGGRNVVRRARHAVEEGRRVMALTAIARGGVQAIERRRRARVTGGGVGARVHPEVIPRFVAARAG